MTPARQLHLTLGAAVAIACGDGRQVSLGNSLPQNGVVSSGGGSGSGSGGDSVGGSGGSSASGSGGRGGAAGGSAVAGGASGGPNDDCSGEAPVGEDLRALLRDALGFGAAVTGGAEGCLYRVTTLDDSGPGSLREGAGLAGPRWIVFDVSGAIDLASPIAVAADKTIDGRGQSVTVRGDGLVLPGVHNVIVAGVAFDGLSEAPEDAIVLESGARDVWIDHCAFARYGDGLIDITTASTNVTVSWSHFFDHSKVMLIGQTATATADEAIRVTLHHNWFDGTYTYHPRLRFGWVHAFNNLFEAWGDYAIGSSMLGQVASEANVFAADGNTEGSIIQIADDPEPGALRSTGDLLLNGTIMIENEPAAVFEPSAYYEYAASEATADLAAAIRAGSGPP